ncbi:isopentenyl-diphosphate Delta-isomerase [Marinigracilibium pacificum]|uniref:Isopentenyl-diphosphate delta-isomerase n=1 Tax=Marinigracilibium pacificum TaxID=2729599 RepID=A0A848J0R3_9BACT|nr:isopentenyl-diphosphate Delta-isomerase [Marinigracilibium pacificum]NMM48140.1 isopentenyl-diphosphate Delta-isomerase [Marinigracilibium pacificum]
MEDQLIVVNEKDEIVGYGEKMPIHKEGLLHRAFSIFVLNDKNELLLQQRALHKYHSAGLWANTCCSHPIKGEDQEITIHRRLQEEMGFDCHLEKIFDFIYKTEFGNGLTEYEFDHVYLGRYNNDPIPNPDEVASFKWIHIDDIKNDMNNNPDQYAYWTKFAIDKFLAKIK